MMVVCIDDPMFDPCRPNVVDGEPTLSKLWGKIIKQERSQTKIGVILTMVMTS